MSYMAHIISYSELFFFPEIVMTASLIFFLASYLSSSCYENFNYS